MHGAALLATALATAAAVELPMPAILHAPLTAFDTNGTVLTSTIEAQAARAAEFGVNFVFVNGGTGEFDTLTVAERKATASKWASAAADNDLYSVINVGTTVQADAIELATHAAANGADAIASVPPYYTRSSDVAVIVEWLAGIAAAAPDLPLWYYHIPGATYVDIKIADLLVAAKDAGLDQLLNGGGIKYVSTDMEDFITASLYVKNTDGVSTRLLFAPEPKLAGFSLASPWGGTVLAEDFYAPTYLRMRAAFEDGDADGALQEQQWKQAQAEPIFKQYGGGAAKRVVYRKFANIEMGPPRLPQVCFDETNYDALVADLDAIGFWDQAPPTPTEA